MVERLIEKARDLDLLIRYLGKQKLPFTVTISSGRTRSLDQNRLQWLWAAEAAGQRADLTPKDVQTEWKLVFGVPILCVEEPKFAAAWEVVRATLTYQQQLNLIAPMPVTSAMKMAPMAEYLTQVLRWNTENGIKLTVPEDLRWGGDR